MIFSPERNRYSISRSNAFSCYSDGPGFGAPDPVEPGPLGWPIEVKENHPVGVALPWPRHMIQYD